MSKLENIKQIIDTNLETMDISDITKNKIVQRTKVEKNRTPFIKFKFISIPAVAAIVLCLTLLTNLLGNNIGVVNAQDLMKGIQPAKVESVKLSDEFIKSQADFSVDIFKESLKSGGNSLVSPLSIYLALAMTANGSDSNTLKEFESVLGKYNINMADINKYCYSYVKNLTDVKTGKLNIANSIWYAQDRNLNMNRSFLQTNADYYGASAYTADFGSQKTVNDINSWVKSHTGNLIDKIVDTIDPNVVMYLINTIYFEAEWQEQYQKYQVENGKFNLADGRTIPVEFMHSFENGYLKDDMAQGFIKPYKDNKFSFVAMLPNEGVSVDAYAASLTGEKFLSLIKNKADETVQANIPKFKSEYSNSLVNPLKTLGLKDCFNPGLANFSKMADDNLFVSEVKHKTYIQVDTLGTKAGAATAVEITKQGIEMPKHKVILDRPFVYAIIDNETGLPILIGTMHSPK